MPEIKVVKIGGKVAEDENSLNAFLQEFVHLKGHKVLVHGGGVIATRIAEKLGIETVMIDGRRVTDKPMLDVATMVYAGLINKKLVAKLQALGLNAIGLTGADLNLIHSVKRNPVPFDFGFVGDIDSVRGSWLKVFTEQGIVPVLAPLTHDGQGNLLNTNADSIASFVASAIAVKGKVDLILCFDMPGVMNGDKMIREINPQKYQELKASGVIKDGMIPKLDLGFKALSEGVRRVIIKDYAALNDQGKGTILVNG